MQQVHQVDLNRDAQNIRSLENSFGMNFSPEAAKEFDSIKYSSSYPAASILFMENETARGVYLLYAGRVKLSVSSSAGKTLILGIAKPGEILGMTASMSDAPYESTAETLHASQIAFIRRSDFSQFVVKFPEVYQMVVHQLSLQYNHACQQLRTVGLAFSAHEKLARLLLDWSAEGRVTTEGMQIKVPLTHEQIAECVGSTRETVTRVMTEFKNRHLVIHKGATMIIPNREALEAISGA
jgi:CRP/FNR family transcriptional regulator, cyclic AMP receptor protein